MTLQIDARIRGGDLPDPAAVIPPKLMSAVTEATLLLERAIKLATPIGVTGVARGSIGHEIRRGVGLERGVRIRAELGSPAKHVEVLERGRTPGRRRPPVEALELWVRRRLGIRNRKEARGVAFVIARSIGAKGTDAVEMFAKAAEDNEAKIQRIFEAAGLDIAVRLTRRERS